MVKSLIRTTLILLSSTLALANVSCSSNPINTTPPPVAKENLLSETETKSASPPASLSHQKLALSQPNPYELALDKAYSASSIGQSAESSGDWSLVVRQWTDAIALLKTVPKTSPNKVIAQTKIAEYQRNLSYARQQVTLPSQKNPTSVIALIPESPSSLPVSGTDAVEAPSPASSQPVFRASIKRRISGTPVIEVTFNGNRQFEMIVDTGASGTVITQQTAAALGVVPTATAKANTASAKNVEFSIGQVSSIQVNGAVVKDVAVAIAPSPELETGLLGHDFFGNYDVTIKRDVVEFRPR